MKYQLIITAVFITASIGALYLLPLTIPTRSAQAICDDKFNPCYILPPKKFEKPFPPPCLCPDPLKDPSKAINTQIPKEVVQPQLSPVLH
jgi:hypothetical protein